jgi:hypothetical protein
MMLLACKKICKFFIRIFIKTQFDTLVKFSDFFLLAGLNPMKFSNKKYILNSSSRGLAPLGSLG